MKTIQEWSDISEYDEPPSPIMHCNALVNNNNTRISRFISNNVSIHIYYIYIYIYIYIYTSTWNNQSLHKLTVQWPTSNTYI